jgi:hypothetical protein
VRNAKPWAVGACGHRRGNSGAGSAAVQTGCLWARAVLTGWAGTVDMGWVQSGAQLFPIIQTLLQF